MCFFQLNFFQKFKEETLKMENTEDLLSDAIDSAFNDPDSDQEIDDVLQKIYDELDLERGGNMPFVPMKDPFSSTASTQPPGPSAPGADDFDNLDDPYDTRR